MNNEFPLHLSLIKDISEREIFNLMENFSSFSDINNVEISFLSKTLGIRDKTINMIRRREINQDNIDRLKKLNVKTITYKDKEYPKRLLNYKPFPPLIFTRGDISILENKSIAMVGSRQCSYYGKKIAEEFGKALSNMGIVVVSGMALGIDRYSHEGALKSSGKTVAVLGTGIDVIYPASNRSIYKEIIEKGCVISEFPPGTGPFKQNFPFRNRIIAGLSNGVLVVEAAYKSGTFKTVKWALDYGIDVFAIPGDINRITSQGTDLLIKEGAIPVISPNDIIEYLGIPLEKSIKEISNKNKELKGDLKIIYNKIKSMPVHFDELLEKTGLSISELSSIAIQLEMKELIKKLPGNYFRRM